MTEREEMKELLMKMKFDPDEWEWYKAHLDNLNEKARSRWNGTRKFAEYILSLQTPTCRIAVVEKEGELPEKRCFLNGEQGPCEDCQQVGYCQGWDECQYHMLNDHWVREVKG